MNIKEKMGILAFSALLVFGTFVSGVAAEMPYLGLNEICVEIDDVCVEWQGKSLTNTTDFNGSLLVVIDDEIVLEENISSDIHTVAKWLISPKEWTQFQLNTTNGTHQILVFVYTDGGVVEEGETTYLGEDFHIDETVEEEVEEEENVEDWLPCP